MTVQRKTQTLRSGMRAWALQRHQALSLEAASAQPLYHRLSMPVYTWMKRATDLVFSLILLLAAAPLMAVTALAIKSTSRGPILFRQFRAGKHGQPFYMLKFRSMHVGSEQQQNDLKDLNELTDGPCFKLRKDPRLTSVGRLIRRTSIDELPQLFNVLKGEMSLVGPRPLPLPEINHGTHAERVRLSVPPGLTCLWQISGRSEIPYQEWMQLDLYYVENRSLLLDMEILVKTIPAVLSCRGAF